MEDSKIINLYWARSQRAIPETDKKYGAYCAQIARNILNNEEDAKECLNDTYLNAWYSMPPERPGILSAFLGRITRNISINRYRKNNALSRGNGEVPLILDELNEVVSGNADTEAELEKKELVREINTFLYSKPRQKRDMFICRYFYGDSIKAIAASRKTSEGAVTMALSRLRNELKEYLEKRGYEI